ncbi:MAG TPA: Crp/Fnr family transcriptional regulator [Gammaproteobacteria bacterium]|nr:Crp/Fnr family transcriptional regulator [Gammaproteobacteria bacterium]
MSLELTDRQGEHTKCNECPIRKMALFKRVPAKNLEWTQDYRSTQLVLPAKKHLYQEGDKPKYVYTLFSGWVKLYKTLANGKKQVLRFALPGDFLGFQGDFSGPVLHSAQALTQSVLCAFPRNRILSLFEAEPTIASEMILMNARDMNVCQEHLLSTGVRNARERIAFLLLEIYYRLKVLNQFATEGLPENTVHVPITQEDIAEAVGMTQIHVNRTLQQMKEEGLLLCANQKLVVLNEQALIEMASFDPKLFEQQVMY